MAKLYFRYGAMGSSKTANALMVAYNYKERGKKVLLAKPKLDTREVGVMHSRIGLEQPCIYVEDPEDCHRQSGLCTLLLTFSHPVCTWHR